VERFFASNGEDISASSTAVRFRDLMVITPVCDRHIRLCRLSRYA
jgi:hypothetical protein